MQGKGSTRCFLAAGVMLASLVLAAPRVHAAYDHRVLGDNPLAYYRMQESNPSHLDTAADSSSNANDGTYAYDFVGGVGPAHGEMVDIAGARADVTPGKQFIPSGEDGASLDVPALTGANAPAFTFEFFFRPGEDTYNGLQAIYTTDGPWATGDIHLNINGANIELAVSGTGSAQAINLQSLVPVGQWAHIAVTYEVSGLGTDVLFYVDGVNVGGTFALGSTIPVNFDVASMIGQWGTVRDFRGSLDEFAIYDVALSSEQVAAHLVPTPAILPAGLVLLGALMVCRRV